MKEYAIKKVLEYIKVMNELLSVFLVAADEVPEAMYELGLCYIHGLGTEQDVSKAVACFNDAAQRGVPEAQYELGVCYRRGEGVEQEYKGCTILV